MSNAALRRVFSRRNNMIFKVNFTNGKVSRNKVINLNEITLINRLLIHLNESKPLAEVIDIRKFTANKTEAIGVKSECDKKGDVHLLDEEYCLRTKDMDNETIFSILHSYMTMMPHIIVQLKFYESAVNHLHDSLEFLTLPERLKLMFYIGLQKKTKVSQSLMKGCLRTLTTDEITGLCINDLCVLCNSTFKTSTKIKNPVILQKIIETLNGNLHVFKDPALLVTLLKTLRHNRSQNEDVLSTMSCTILFNSTTNHYSFGEICHILAAYVDHLYYDEAILKLFAERCVELLAGSKVMPLQSHITVNIRVKDIKRFLWAYSYIGYKLDAHVLSDVVLPKIMDRLAAGHYKDDPESLFLSVLYMWILKYQAVELVPYCFYEKNIKIIRESKSKHNERLNLLLVCMQLENLQLYKKTGVKPQNFQNSKMQQQVSLRPHLHRVYNCLRLILPKVEFDKFEFECQIPHLSIVGITGYRKIYKTVFVEVFDEYVCVKNQSSVPAGPMQLKLRFLEKMDQGLVIISSEDIKEMTDEELEEHLLEEINMVC